MASSILFLVVALARLRFFIFAAVEVQSHGFCALGDEMCHLSPKALLQKHSRITRNLAALDSVASEHGLSVSTADEIENTTGKVMATREDGLDESAYQDVAAKCCWRFMKPFVVKVVQKLGFEVCDEGGLMGLLWWFDCTNDGQNYDSLENAIKGLGPDATTGHKGDCPFIGWPECKDFPKDRTCPELYGPLPECQGETTMPPRARSVRVTVPPPVVSTTVPLGSTTSTTTMCTETNWEAEVFAACDFWGDPHWKATFYAGRYPNEYGKRWDFYGNGIFEVASTTDGSFKMQSFQCKVENGKAAVAVALAIQLDGKSYFIHDGDAELDGISQTVTDQLVQYKYDLLSESQCVRMNLGIKKRSPRGIPSWAHRVVLRVHKDIVANDGLCEVDKTPEVVPDAEVMFTQAQIDIVCAACTIQTPSICSKSLLQGGLSSRPAESATHGQAPKATPMSDVQMAEQACNDARPKISLSDAEDVCSSALDVAACVIDYCSTNGDQAMADMAIAERTHFLPGCKAPGDACSSKEECCDRMTCDHSVCKYPELATCSQPKSNADECMPHPQGGYRSYATNSSSVNMRCANEFLIRNDVLGKKIFETNDLDGCAELCDATAGCIGFDFKSTKQESKAPGADPSVKIHRCCLCQEVLDMCPALIQTESVNGQVKYYHQTTSGCAACKNSGDSCSSSQDCCNGMICDNTVCKDSQLVACAEPKENEDTCVNGHAYATSNSNQGKRCKPNFVIPSRTTDYHETDSLEECADLCDDTEGCVAFDFKNRLQPSQEDPSNPLLRKYRCSLCKEVGDGCPTLKNGQYNHYHLTYSGCL